MILFDISSAFHMCTHGIAKAFAKDGTVNLKEYEQEFFRGMLWIIDNHTEMFRRTYGEPLICIDDKSLPTWRKTYYPNYKAGRKNYKDSISTFSYSDAYYLLDKFLGALKYSGIKHIGVPEAEADDIILVLGHYLANNNEPIMILSPDKDFIQLQTNPLVSQYSWFTKKIITVSDKSKETGEMKEWLVEHICLGDHTDAVPRIVDFREFKPGVKEYLEQKGFFGTPFEFSGTEYDIEEFEQFGGIFETQKFGPATLKKLITKHGDLKQLLESDSLLKQNFNRNFKLVMREGIPKEISDRILETYQQPKEKEDIEQFANVLGLNIQDLPKFMQDKYIRNNNNFLDF